MNFDSLRKNILADIDKALIILLFFSLPFDKTPSFELFTVTIKASSIIGLLIILRVIYLIINKKISINYNFAYKVLAAFIIWIILLIPVSINFNKSFEYVTFSTFVILMAISISLIYKKEYNKSVVGAIFISAIIVSVFGILQYFADYYNMPNNFIGLSDLYTKKTFGFTRITSFLLEPLYLASYMALPLSLSCSLLINKNIKYNYKKLAILVLVFSFIIFMSLSRGGIYASLASVIFISIVTYFSKSISTKKLSLAIFLLILSFIFSQITISLFNRDPSDFTQGKKGASAYLDHVVDPQTDPLDTRTAARARAINEIKNNPSYLILGIGPGQYGPYVTANKQIQGRWPSLNNLPLALSLELGLLGLALVAVFTIYIIFLSVARSFKEKDLLTKIFLVSLSGYLIAQGVSYQTYSTLYIMHIWAVLGILMALAVYKRKKLVFKV
jgi:hypothetical protein